VYGVRLDSAWTLPYPRKPSPWLAEISLGRGSANDFRRALYGVPLPADNGTPWLAAPLPDGSRYLRWSGVFEFIIPKNGRCVLCRPLTSEAVGAFHTHLGPSLSFALINLGIEPLHSTTLVIDGKAIALMGDCGYGKSSLGASFVHAGAQLLTDDLLVTSRVNGRFVAHAGAPRVKLFPTIARRIFGNGVDGLRLRRLTPKLIIPLDDTRACRTPTPLKAIYLLTPPHTRTPRHVVIRPLPPRRVFVELVRNTFNMAVEDPSRLERQFELATRLALSVPVKSLSYPREFPMLSAAREAILADLQRS
jgi:hypothetical protein